MKNDLLVEYLTFEGEYIQEELEWYESTNSEKARDAVVLKRKLALADWWAQGREIPEMLKTSFPFI